MLQKPSRGVAVMTGASSGIGRTTALLFARKGWAIGPIARNRAPLPAGPDLVGAAIRGRLARRD